MREHKNTSTSCSRVTSISLSLQNERSTRKANTDPHGAWTRDVYRRAPSHVGAKLENCLSRDKVCQAMSKARTFTNDAGGQSDGPRRKEADQTQREIFYCIQVTCEWTAPKTRWYNCTKSLSFQVFDLSIGSPKTSLAIKYAIVNHICPNPSPLPMMQGAASETSQNTFASVMLPTQQSAAVRPAAWPRLPQPEPPHVPHAATQQTPEVSTPSSPLLHI